jgi:hypothetical protein
MACQGGMSCIGSFAMSAFENIFAAILSLFEDLLGVFADLLGGFFGGISG